MTVYTIEPREDSELCHPRDPGDFERIIQEINGLRRADNWNPIEMRLIRRDEGRDLLEADSPWLGSHALVFGPRVVERLGELLVGYGELLPLHCDDRELVIFNVTKVVDGLDESASQIVRFASGRIMDIERYAFLPNVVRGIEVFKLPGIRASPTFVGQEFVKAWKSVGLRGLDFTQVWAAV